MLATKSSIGQGDDFCPIEVDLSVAVAFQKHNYLYLFSAGVAVEEVVALLGSELVSKRVTLNDSEAILADYLQRIDSGDLAGDRDVVELEGAIGVGNRDGRIASECLGVQYFLIEIFDCRLQNS